MPWYVIYMSYKEFCMICCRSCQFVHRTGAGDTWVFFCSLDVSVDLWGPALCPHSAWYSHSSNIFRHTAQLLPLSVSQWLSLHQDPTTLPQSYLRIVYDPKTFLSYCFWNRSSSIVPLLSVHCHTFQLWLSREISWLVLAGLKLVLAGLYWQYTGPGVQTRDVSCSTLR